MVQVCASREPTGRLCLAFVHGCDSLIVYGCLRRKSRGRDRCREKWVESLFLQPHSDKARCCPTVTQYYGGETGEPLPSPDKASMSASISHMRSSIQRLCQIMLSDTFRWPWCTEWERSLPYPPWKAQTQESSHRTSKKQIAMSKHKHHCLHPDSFHYRM